VDFRAGDFCCLVLLPIGGVVYATQCKPIAALIGSYVDERTKMTNRPPAAATAVRLSKMDVTRLYRRSARQLGHSQADQRFHLELLRLTKAADYEPGRRILLSHSNRFLEQRCGMSRSTLGRQLRRHDGETLHRSISGNGHRYSARERSETGDGTIIDGCGISLDPLIALMTSMQPMIAAQDELDLALALEKARIGRNRRRQSAALDDADGNCKVEAVALIAQSQSLTPAIRSAFACGRLAELETLSQQVGEIADRLERMVNKNDAAGDQQWTPQGCDYGHVLPIQSPDSCESVVAIEDVLTAEDDTAAQVSCDGEPTTSRWTPRSMVASFPSLTMYTAVTPADQAPSWRSIDAAASRLARDLGINASCWHSALAVMGAEERCVAIALVAELLSSGHITSTAGQYFGGMLKRARSGELHLDRSVWGFRRKNYSK
jgi:replication initiation protein RepC